MLATLNVVEFWGKEHFTSSKLETLIPELFCKTQRVHEKVHHSQLGL